MDAAPNPEAVIVAGGFGTRMRPLTLHRPKHLLPVAGVPFLAHQLAKLAACGVRRVVLATSYRASDFEPVFGDGTAYGLQLEYVSEPEPLGTGGAIRNAARCLDSASDDPVVVLNGDVLSGHDLGRQLLHHRRSGAAATLHLVEVEDARAFGCVPTDEQGRVTAFIEKSPDPVSRQVNAGCYVFTRSVIDQIPVDRPVSVERETFPQLLAGGAVLMGHLESGYWLDVGTPHSLVKASADLVRGIATSPAYPHPPAEQHVRPGARVAAGATVCGGSAISAGAVVESGAVVEGSVLADGAQVGERARVHACVIGPRARIGAGVVLRGAVVADEAVVGEP